MQDLQATLIEIMGTIAGYIWSWPMLIVLITTGLYLTVSLKGLQFRLLGHSLSLIIKDIDKDKRQKGDISHFQALMTALCATVGTGNIAGVATAIALGGPGAVFWMWMTGLLGMATKYSESLLAIHYRRKDDNGHMIGGPMHYIAEGLNMKWLGVVFAFFLLLGTFGGGTMVQSNSVADAFKSSFNIDTQTTAVIITLLAAIVIIGGIKRIGQVAAAVAPTMILAYILAGSYVLFMNASAIPDALVLIIDSAFNGTAAAGGFAGATIAMVLRYGMSRGVFSNEAGLGTSCIAAAAAKTHHPAEQALISMTQSFIDTLVICTFTALIIITSGLWTMDGASDMGASLTAMSFAQTLNLDVMGVNLGEIIVAICLIFFAFSTILGWHYYGERASVYLFGNKGTKFYNLAFLSAVFIGAVAQLQLIWLFADIAFGLLAFPNAIALMLLAKKTRALTFDYFEGEKNNRSYKVQPFANMSEEDWAVIQRRSAEHLSEQK